MSETKRTPTPEPIRRRLIACDDLANDVSLVSLRGAPVASELGPGPEVNVYRDSASYRMAVRFSFSRSDLMMLREIPRMEEGKFNADSPEARAIVRMLDELTRRRSE